MSFPLADVTVDFEEDFSETLVTVPAVLIGIILGPVSAKFLDAERWGSAAEGQQESITLVSTRSRLQAYDQRETIKG